MSRLRIRYAKRGRVRFLSHRDVARCLERAVRRAGLPVAYSQGFSPRARLHFGLALSNGFEGDAEYFDVDLVDGRAHVAVDELAGALSDVLPEGIDVAAVVPIEAGTPSLQEAVVSCTWRFTVADASSEALAEAAAQLTARESIPLTLVRKGKQVSEDLRPLLGAVVAEPGERGAELTVDLGTKPRSVRPVEFLSALDAPELVGDVADVRVLRTHQWINVDGRRCEPISLGAPSTHVEERAS